MYDNHDRFPVRKSPRLKGYDYTSYNYYFVTICTRNKECLFGSPAKASAMGRIAGDCLRKIPAHFPDVIIDKWVVMPNHIHAIVVMPGTTVSLPTVVGQYKGAVTKEIRTICPDAQIWQTSFHDRVIRNQGEYERIWAYMDANPARWMDDCFYTP